MYNPHRGWPRVGQAVGHIRGLPGQNLCPKGSFGRIGYGRWISAVEYTTNRS